MKAKKPRAENPRVVEFAHLMGKILPHTLVAQGQAIRWLMVINPKAGGFTIRSRWVKHRAILRDYALKAEANPLREDCGPHGDGVFLTAGPGEAEKAAASLAVSLSGPDTTKYIIITAGGAGTSLEVFSALYHAPDEARDRFAVLRLPLGTGNDGADAAELDRALDLLIKPVDIVKARAVRLRTAAAGDKGPFLAFNILSLGLDAFVTHMTNKMKGKLPGDSYKLWVDIAALLYDRIYTVGPMDVRVLDEDGAEAAGGKFREDILLLAMGAGGHRTYGSHKKILPDDRNVCAIRQMPLLRKLTLKELFNTGTHVDKPEAILFTSGRVELSAYNPILAQMDGETVLLRKEDFPAVLECTAPVIPTLKLR
jgi:diacylglycerol kinase family enzyme